MVKLSVNVNKVATLRNTRTIGIPSVVHIARLALEAGADGITVHPRPDARHITSDDVLELADLLAAWPEREYNIEGNPFHGELLDLVARVRPDQVTLVPDDPGAFTSNQGWDLERDGERLRPVIERLQGAGCRVSLFMDADSPDIERAGEIGAERIELYTEPYAAAFASGEYAAVLERFAEASRRAALAGIGVNAGHDLNLVNLPPFVAVLPNLLEVSIGHALIADALELGIAATVERYRERVARVEG